MRVLRPSICLRVDVFACHRQHAVRIGPAIAEHEIFAAHIFHFRQVQLVGDDLFPGGAAFGDDASLRTRNQTLAAQVERASVRHAQVADRIAWCDETTVLERADQTSANISPPRPLLNGSTTFRVNAAATAASAAFPPDCKTDKPATAASGWVVASMPFVAATTERRDLKYGGTGILQPEFLQHAAKGSDHIVDSAFGGRRWDVVSSDG